ncbi:tyrosine-protein phosphatase siw14 [Emydomyces testavorans]|uniref:diphosphoinositol-polyphosphate diphosphatase n=1 Tax=Emydomyces testavorans TaxID=2070801 RepID=A0AAF0DCC3_9EURO|nr:tyrosine-protein phosphatase siw14 [Emydomyces testavorans]
MGDDRMSSPDAEVPMLMAPGFDGAEKLTSETREYFTSGWESGPSRPPTPHGPGLPANFAEVVNGIYRSSYPLPDHFESIKKLNLKTIVTLVDREPSRQFKKFMKDNGITSYVIPIIANKDPKVFTPQSTILEVLKILFDTEKHPVLVHCNKGKHRTGCVIACFRRAQGWPHVAALSEYIKYSTPKARVLDRKYIESFNANILCDLVDRVGAQYWAPSSVSEQKEVPDNLRNNSNGNIEENGEVDGATTMMLTSDAVQFCDLKAM